MAEELPVYVAVASPAYLHQYCLEGQQSETWCDQVYQRGGSGLMPGAAKYDPIHCQKESSAVEAHRHRLGDYSGWLPTTLKDESWKTTCWRISTAKCRHGGNGLVSLATPQKSLCVILSLQYSMPCVLEIVIFFL